MTARTLLNKLLVIAGPTGSGKTDCALAVAREVDGEVICADSRTVYSEMQIGTAKPVGQQVEDYLLVHGIRHYGLDLAKFDEKFNVADFQLYARDKIAAIWERGHLPLLVGGTGLYLRAVLDGFTLGPIGSDTLRAELEAKSLAQLVTELKARDPVSYNRIDIHNKHRVLRALEVKLTAGNSVVELRGKEPLKADILFLGLDVPRAELYRRINTRMDNMVTAGLVEEVRTLVARYGESVQALSGIGYRELLPVLRDEEGLETALDKIRQHSRNYAKRQLTWFRSEQRLEWVSPDQVLPRVRRWVAASVT
jgi:tRNA dimethylallyltransferase